MKYPFYSGLSGKNAIIFLVAFLIVVLPVNLIVYQKLKVTLVQSDTQQLLTEAEKLTGQIKLDPVIVPLPAIGYAIHVQEFNEGFYQTLFISPSFPQLEEEFYFLDSFDLDTLKIVTTRTPLSGNQSELVFSIARSNRQLSSQLSELKLYLFYITGIAIIIMVILVFALSAVLFRPIKKIIASAENIQGSESMERLPIPSAYDETQQLAVALNEMIGRIEKTLQNQISFFDSATHELKTPLAIIKAQLTLPGENTTGPGQSIMPNLLEEIERLDRTISDFLLLSQLKTKSLTLRKEKFDLNELIFASLSKLNKIALSKNIQFNFIQPDVDVTMEADRDKIQTVVINILENAIQNSPSGNKVKINITRIESIRIEIENFAMNPILDIEKLGKERYSNSTSSRGMGLGLWICNQIVDLHGGKLDFTLINGQFLVKISFV